MAKVKNIDTSIKATIISDKCHIPCACVDDKDTSINATIITSFGKATTIKEGVVRLATEQEAKDGILNNNVVINPYTLKYVLSDIETEINIVNETVTSNYNTLDGRITSNNQAITTINNTINTYGDIVTYNATDFATSAQGALADTALQPNDNISELNNDAGYITGITSNDVTTALGYAPYDASNPDGYITSSALNGYATENWVDTNFQNVETINIGIDWLSATANTNLGSNKWTALTYGTGKFLSLGRDGYISTSTDYINWTPATANTNLGANIWFDVIFDGSKFIAIGQLGYISTSTDGTTWTTASQNANLGERGWCALNYNNDKYIALSYDGYISTSTNGTTWTSASLVSNLGANNWTALTYGDKYVAISYDGHISTSTNGTTWTSAVLNSSLGDNSWTSIAYDGTKYIALGRYGYVSTSTDGITWTTATYNSNIGENNWYSILYHNSALYISGTTGYLSTSVNGTILSSIYGDSLLAQFANGNTYTLLNNSTGLIPNDRISTDIARISDIPTKTSELTNNSGFITNTVNNLTNYYLKSETYTKLEVQQLIASIPQFSVEVVQALPATGERMVLYLVPKDGTAPDVYDEYIWVEDEEEFELIGSTAVDLTDYVTNSDLATALSDYALTSDIPTDNSELTNGAGYITGINQADVIDALGYTPYNATNPNGYITSSALNGYATENWVNNKGYITGITSSDVTTALGYTPYNSTNPNGYITSSALNGYATETYVNNGLATKQNTLTAGDNITINGDTISAVDTTYTAGTGISIENGVISNTQTSAEWGNIEGNIADQTDLIELLDGKQDLLTADNGGTDIAISTGGVGDDVTVSGNGSILLEKAEADSLNSVTLTGGCEQTATPSPSTPVDITTNNGNITVSPNLFRTLGTTTTQGGVTFTPQADGSVICTGRATAYYSYYLGRADFDPSTIDKITVAINGTFNASGNIVVDKFHVYSGSTSLGTISYTTWTQSVTVDIANNYPTADNIRIYLKRNSNTDTNATIRPMAVKGTTNKAWKPYGQITITGTVETVTDEDGNTATAENLLAVGNYADTQELITGAVNRQLAILVLTGTESWSGNSSNSYFSLAKSAITPTPTSNSCAPLCTHLVGANTYESVAGTIYFGASYLNVNYNNEGGGSSSSARANFNNWLKTQFANGTPVIVVYPLATETTETVTGQTLTTIDGDNTLTISQASINNLPISANYTQKAGMTINFTNDTGYITSSALSGYVQSSDLATVATTGDYSDLSGTPTIPTTTNDLVNNSGFITNAVNDLTNYYTKSETYTQAEVQGLIANIPNFTVSVVQQLPQTGTDLVLYFVPKNGTSPDVYDEYIWVNNAYELIGNTQVDLSNYVTTSDLTTTLADYATETWVGNQGYITGITSSDVTTALGYTPYNSTNPNGYITNSALADYVTNSSLSTTLADYVLSSSLATVATTGAYSDLTGTPTIPSALSDITVSAGSNITINGDTISATDTTYSNFTGCDSITAGTSGLVPAPSAGDEDKFLKADGTWDTITVDQVYDGTSTNPQSGVAIAGELSTNYQAKLVSGTNIKTVGGISLLGSGNIAILGNTASGTKSLGISNRTTSSNYSTYFGYDSYSHSLGGSAFGYDAKVETSSTGGTAIGQRAVSSANYAIQIGNGTNSTASSLNIGFGYDANANDIVYQLLDGTTGFIPDARLSTNIARTSDIPTATSDLTNDSGYITGITSTDVTTALGYTPVNKAGDTMTGGLTLSTNDIDNSSININNVSSTQRDITFNAATHRTAVIRSAVNSSNQCQLLLGVNNTNNDAPYGIRIVRDTSGTAYIDQFPQCNAIDGQWVATIKTVISTTTSIPAGTSLSYKLNTYLPNDNYKYEVMYTAVGETAATSGAVANIGVGSDFISTDNNGIVVQRTRTTSSMNWCASGTMIINNDSNRYIYIKQRDANSTCSMSHFRILAYRRLGTNL